MEFKKNLFIQTLRYYRPEITDRTLTLPVQSWPDPAPVTNEIRYDLSLGHWMAKLGTTLQENGKEFSQCADCEQCSYMFTDQEGKKIRKKKQHTSVNFAM